MKSAIELPAGMRASLLFLAIIVAGAMFGLAWRLPGWGLLGVVGLGVFFWTQIAIEKLWPAIGGAILTGTLAYLIACSWLGDTIYFLTDMDERFATALTLPVCVLQGGHFVLFVLSWRLAQKVSPACFWLAPPLWVITEGCWPGLFPCRNGCLLLECPELCQTAEWGGVTLISLIAATISFALALLGWLVCLSGTAQAVRCVDQQAVRYVDQQAVRYVDQPRLTGGLAPYRYYVLAVAIATLGLFGWGHFRISQLETMMALDTSAPLRVLLVQADTEVNNCNPHMIEVSRKFAGEADLVVWPECALGNYNQQLLDFRNPDTVAKNSIDDFMDYQPFPSPIAPLLGGGNTWAADSATGQPAKHFVSAMLFDMQEQLTGRYDKIELMPYGELVPGENVFPVLKTWFGREREINVGSDIHPVGTVDGMKLGVALCCEDMHPNLLREQAHQGADLLVTLGNGMAFDSDVALRQHFRISQMRAIENRRYFLRCNSLGVSGLVSPTGKVFVELPVMSEQAAVINIPRFRFPTTFYSCYGDWMEMLVFVGTVLFVTLVSVRRPLKS